MINILDDEHLESLQCSKCRKYLSVFPVKNHASNEFTCGRCSKDNDDGFESPLHELIAEEFLFKCINRYEGCRKLLRVDETEAHERECIGKSFKCPKCRDDVDRSVLELIWHYKLEHPSSYLKTNSFKGKLPTEDVMLCVQDEEVFFILFQHDSTLNSLRLSAATLTGVDARQAFVVSNESFSKHTEKMSCQSIDSFNGKYFDIELGSIESVRIVFNLEVAENGIFYDISIQSYYKSTALVTDKLCKLKSPVVFRKIYGYELKECGTTFLSDDGKEVDITCSDCKEKMIGLPFFKYDPGLVQVCQNCCIGCNTCKPFVSDLPIHESAICELHRFMKCPECPSNMHLDLMGSHLLHFHQKYFCERFDGVTVQRFASKVKNGEVYYLDNNKWCFLKWSLDCGYLTENNGPYFNFKFGTLDKSNAHLRVAYNSDGHISTSSLIHLREIASFKPYIKFNSM